ncbi:MAG TPA: NAD(P)-dependent oxidoreductase [Longimicrobiales bacterium]
MRLMVTGSAGFIGGHLALALARAGHDVLGLDRRPAPHWSASVPSLVCDLLDAEATRAVLQDFAPDALLHLAARTDLDETVTVDAYADNTTAVHNLLAAIGDTPSVRRAICTSSQLVCPVGYTPAHDEDYRPTTVYGQSKVRTEQIWRAADGAGVEWCIVRPTTIWGPHMNPHYLRMFRMLRSGRYFHVGKGPTLKSYGYVENTVHQYMALLEANAARLHRRTFYLADYQPTALEEWTEAFRRELDGPPIRTLPLPLARGAARVGDVLNRAGLRRYPFNSFRLRNVITPYTVDLRATAEVCSDLPFTLQDGVRRTAPWVRSMLKTEKASA